MTFIVQAAWNEMTVPERMAFLEKLARRIPEFDDQWWGGKPFIELASTSDCKDLPPDLAGRLLMCLHGERFSLVENDRVNKLLKEITSL